MERDLEEQTFDDCPKAMTADETFRRHSKRMCDRVDPNAARRRTPSCGRNDRE